ncbi:MAG: hypothetical protein PHG68_06230 [Candidatus Omnitrophica bacterium]|nr:hypothetical protein [Candidatus Omnitrophota bacterium]
MKKITSLSAAVLLLVSLGIAVPFAESAEDYLNLQVYTRIIRGKITQINRLKSEITINGSDEQGRPQEMTFRISENTRVVKNGVIVSFTSVMQGYEVVVEYYANPKAEQPYLAQRINLAAAEEGSGY